MRRLIHRAVIAAVGGTLVLSCGGDDLGGTDRAWAERATFEIARVNDIVALKLLPAVLGDEAMKGAVTVDGEPTPDWPAVGKACSEVEALLADVRQAGTHAPRQFARAGDNLVGYAGKLEHFVGACHRAVASEDFHMLEVVKSDIDAASSLVAVIGFDLPEGIGCPEHVADRPETCDV